MIAALRINLRILWSHNMKNFQVKHDQCDRIIFLYTFSSESSKKLKLNLGLADRRIIYIWQVLESIHKFIIDIHVLQCLFVRGSSKKQRRVRVISNFTKGETFSRLTWTKLYSCNVIPFASLLHPSKKGLFPLFTDLFWKFPGCSLFPQAE